MLEKIFGRLSKIRSNHRKIILIAADAILISLSYITVWIMQSRRINLLTAMPTITAGLAGIIIAFCVVYALFGMYNSLWRYAEAYEFMLCMIATAAASVLFILGTWFWLTQPMFNQRIPISIYVQSCILSGMSTLFMRVAYRAYRTTRTGVKISTNAKKVLLIGAGETGNAVIADLYRDPKHRYDVICIVDDDPSKQGRKVQGVKVTGNTNDIPRLVSKHGINVIIFAAPSASNNQKRRIINICSKTKCQIKKVPDLFDFVTDSGNITSQISDISVEDLLGRDVITFGMRKSGSYINGRTVLITGGGGSIGSELCRQIAEQKPKSLIILDIYENNAYDIEQELIRKYSTKLDLHVEIASVRDMARLEQIFDTYMPEIVFHAAAHKHVPLMENAPVEAVKNNIYGTLNTVRCADKYGVGRFVMISTDKAVNPTNVMGATKRVCEMIVQAMDRHSKTEYVAVRFGNVLGSNGSVIPHFKKQIADGGPVTVTDPNIIRYFMTIPEAVSLVLKAGEMAKGGEIFVLDMGEPVKILDLAESLIRLSGYEPYKDIDIVFTGLRSGEKLFEELLIDDNMLRTPDKKIFIEKTQEFAHYELFSALDKLRSAAFGNDEHEVRRFLGTFVPEYSVEKNDSEAVAL